MPQYNARLEATISEEDWQWLRNTAEGKRLPLRTYVRMAVMDAVTKNNIPVPPSQRLRRRFLHLDLTEEDRQLLHAAARAAGYRSTAALIRALVRQTRQEQELGE